jgi:outer membrane protein assembly factor BamA
LRSLLLLVVFVVFFIPAQAQDYIVIGRISVEGNQRTKDHIISRELAFRSGDTILRSEFQEILTISRNNLVNSLLFNYVNITEHPIDSVFTDILVQVRERWYLWPYPVFQFADPNFNTWWLSKDFSRTNYGLVVLKRNFRGRNEDLGAKAQLGYSKEFAFMYRVPYLNRKQNMGGGVWASYVQNNEITIGTAGNQRLFFTGNTGNSRDELSLRAHISIRRKFNNYHTAELRYNSVHLLDSITKITTNYLVNDQTSSKYFSLYYTLKSDHRDNKGYPLTGSLAQMDIVHHGLALMNDNGLNVVALTGTISNYFKLSEKLYFAAQLKGKYTIAKQLPYHYQEGMGYNHFIRGYEYYIIDGQHFGLFKSNIKFRLFGPKEHDFKFLKGTGFAKYIYAFYMNLYIDAGYVYDRLYYRENSLANQMLYGSGLGIDFVSFYDKVIRFEYSLNKELQHGFFLHFIKPI